MTKLSDVLQDLKAWFPADAHKERVLPGGAGKWFYIPWTLYLQRLNQVCPDDWEVVFSDPKFLESASGTLCYVTCTLIICGTSRQGIGAVPAEIISSSGKNAERGNAIERAVAESLKNAGEMFSIGSYLDQQTDPNTKNDFIKYMNGHNDGRAATFHHQNEGTLPPKPANRPSQSKPFGGKPNLSIAPSPTSTTAEPMLASPAQMKRFWAIAKQAGYTDQGCKALVASLGFASSKEVPVSAYEELCRKAADPEIAAVYNDRVATAEPAF